jgi:serine/threonine-protein kinase
MVTTITEASSCDPDGRCELGPETIVGGYRIDRLIGEGSMSTVWAATHPTIGKRAAIKVLRAPLSFDSLAVDRFIREARALSAIAHPNIVDVFAFGELPDGRSYFMMELLLGETLFELLSRRTVDVGEVIDILLQVCGALAAAHEKGIVHRDLKPENIFVLEEREGQRAVKLFDFGIAKLLGREGDDGLRHTLGDSVMGTPSYMSPEQVLSRQVGCSSDVYSLGVVAYEMLAGHLPFEGDSVYEVLHLQVNAAPASLRDRLPTIPEALDRLILAMLQKQGADRPSVAEVSAALHAMREPAFRIKMAGLGSRGPLRLPLIAVLGLAGLLTWRGYQGASPVKPPPACPHAQLRSSVATSALRTKHEPIKASALVRPNSPHKPPRAKPTQRHPGKVTRNSGHDEVLDPYVPRSAR